MSPRSTQAAPGAAQPHTWGVDFTTVIAAVSALLLLCCNAIYSPGLVNALGLVNILFYTVYDLWNYVLQGCIVQKLKINGFGPHLKRANGAAG